MQVVNSFLHKIPSGSSLLVAYSGGVDSHVLLHLLSRAREDYDFKLKVIHINHQLQESSDMWEYHCSTVSQSLDVPFISFRVKVDDVDGNGPEDRARIARYQKFSEVLSVNDYLVMAHHQDDQVETLLLNILRGSGVEGLSGIPRVRKFASGFIARPLLSVSRSEILAYALSHNLKWVEDPSNKADDFDRNFLRNNVVPLLNQRWSHNSKAFSRVAENAEDVSEFIASKIKVSLGKCLIRNNILDVTALKKFSKIEQNFIIRQWLHQSGFSYPSRSALKHLYDEVIGSVWGATPELKIGKAILRRYRNRLFLLYYHEKPLHENLSYRWSVNESLDFGSCKLVATNSLSGGLRKPLQSELVEVRFRAGGERIKIHGRGVSKRVKSLFQEWGIPPWERASIPLVYYNDKLVAVAGFAVAEGYYVAEGGININVEHCEVC